MTDHTDRVALGEDVYAWPGQPDNSVERGRDYFLDAIRASVPDVLLELERLSHLTDSEAGKPLAAWARRFYLTDGWCLEAAHRTLAGWRRRPPARNSLHWARRGYMANATATARVGAMRVDPVWKTWEPVPNYLGRYTRDRDFTELVGVRDDGSGFETTIDLDFDYWDPEFETRAASEARMRDIVEALIRANSEALIQKYHDAVEGQARLHGMRLVPERTRKVWHFLALALWQVGRLSYGDVVDHMANLEIVPPKTSTQAVRKAVIPTAAHIGLTLRPPHRGGRPHKN